MIEGARARGLALATTALAFIACGQQGSRSSSDVPDHAARSAVPADTRAVTDMRGVTVRVPTPVTRVATINDGFVESVMTRLGTIRSLVAVGSSSQQRTWSYTYPGAGGSAFSVSGGMGTMRVLHPWIDDLPCASRTSGDAVNIETIAAAKPQVVILRVGDCTIGTDPAGVERLAGVLDAMGIPAVVLRSPADYRGHGTGTLREEIGVLGQVFDREKEAEQLTAELDALEAEIRARASGADAESRPRVLYIGLAPTAREAGGAAYVWGVDSAESWMIERILGAENAYRGAGSRVLLNAEQILALDPDVIFLPTSAGYHPPRELLEAIYFRDLRRLRAVRTGRVHALPWTPMNCARRLEYPIDLMIMAKGAYPDRFGDIIVHEWVLNFYRNTYGVGDAEARALRRAQWLEWTAEQGF